MAKPELRDHRKFLKLCRLLAAPIPHVLGYLDCLWNRGYQTGNPFIGDDDDVEAAAMFPGDRGAFARAAFESGFLDRDEAGQFTIHDLYEHAPKYAKARIDRAGFGPKTSQTGPSRSQTGQFSEISVPNGPVTVPPNQTKPNLNAIQPPPPPEAGGAETPERPVAGRSPRKRPRHPPGGTDRPATGPLVASNGVLVAAGPTPGDLEPFVVAVCEVTGRDRVTAWKTIRTVALRLHAGNFTADAVREFGRRFPELCPWARERGRARPTPREVSEHIGLIRDAESVPPADGQTKYRQRVAEVAGIVLQSPEHGIAGRVRQLSPGGGSS